MIGITQCSPQDEKRLAEGGGERKCFLAGCLGVHSHRFFEFFNSVSIQTITRFRRENDRVFPSVSINEDGNIKLFLQPMDK